jgi:muconolactone delta-isomerase
MEFLVEFNVHVPDGTAETEIEERDRAESAAAAELARTGKLVRIWRAPAGRAIGLYRADSRSELDNVLSALPLRGWMQTTVTALQAHPNDPPTRQAATFGLPDPRLSPVYRLEATLGEPHDLGHGHRRIAPLTGGVFNGPEMKGTLVGGASADWQTVLADGTAFGDIRYTLQTDVGDLLYVQSRSIRHGPAQVLARLSRGEDVDPSEYTFRAATQIETGAPALDWLNTGVFLSVGGRAPGRVIYETYLIA